MPQMYADLAIPASVDKLFTYSIPETLLPTARRGVRALAPFGKRRIIGVITDVHDVKPRITTIRPLDDILDDQPFLSDELLSLTRWISEYYMAPLGDVLKAALPREALKPRKRVAHLAPGAAISHSTLPERQSAILNILRDGKGSTVQQLQKQTGFRQIYSIIHELQKKGYILVEDESPAGPKPKYEQVVLTGDEHKARWHEWLGSLNSANGKFERQKQAIEHLLTQPAAEIPLPQFLKSSGASLSTMRTLEKKKLVVFSKREVLRTESYDVDSSGPGPVLRADARGYPVDARVYARVNIVLNRDQSRAVESIAERIRSNEFHSFLLHGITGSGKTQVYIEAIRKALEMGKTAIVLIPEISLTPQTVRRFKEHFGDKVVTIHSRLSVGERFDTWRMIREGKCSIVIGPRSAIFVPLKNLGLIVVDEEHEPSFKQFDQSPRYHGRDVAIMRAHLLRAVVVLGTATPSLESYANAVAGKYTLLELPERADNARLPRIEIVDMTAERQRRFTAYREQRKLEFKEDAQKARASKRSFSFDMISDKLKEHIALRLQKNEGIILLQNRRGFAPVVECGDCGYVERCERCEITMTYHLTQKHLRCHYCGNVKRPAEGCPNCKGPDMEFRGFGTQRVEEEIRGLFPSARLLRMDLDTTTQRGSHDRILKKFGDGDADILLGTQMVGKGLDFPRVTLVGVISADVQMLLPDFRSAERTFQLLTQVSGRAGRSVLAGEVIVQTFQPDHYTLRHVLTHNFKSFYDEENAFRKELLYPPYSRIVLIECKGTNDGEVQEHITFIADSLRTKNTFVILGPAPAAIPKINDRFRWHIVLKDSKSKDPSSATLHRAIGRAMEAYSGSRLGKSKKVQCLIDIDPVGMM